MLGYVEPPQPQIVMERTERKTLASLLKRGAASGYTFKRGFQIVLDICAAVSYLHEKHKFVHGNLKSGNIFVDQDWNGKLGGLGGSLESIAKADQGGETFKSSDMTSKAGHTPAWSSPEVLESAEPSQASDMYRWVNV